MSLVEEVKKKREFSGLPDSIVERVVEKKSGDIKDSRVLLRKYFGVFLTNKIMKGKLGPEEMLVSHISSSRRDYESFYKEIFEGIKGINFVIDLGCGVNGFSYKFLKNVIGSVEYVGLEAAGQLVDQMNKYFEEKIYLARVIKGDLFEIDKILDILKKQNKKRVVFLFQVVDALESLEKNFSKKLIKEISKECELLILSLPTSSLGGKTRFAVNRKWLVDFLKEFFVIKKDFEKNGERIFVLTKRKVPQ